MPLNMASLRGVPVVKNERCMHNFCSCELEVTNGNADLFTSKDGYFLYINNKEQQITAVLSFVAAH